MFLTKFKEILVTFKWKLRPEDTENRWDDPNNWDIVIQWPEALAADANNPSDPEQRSPTGFTKTQRKQYKDLLSYPRQNHHDGFPWPVDPITADRSTQYTFTDLPEIRRTSSDPLVVVNFSPPQDPNSPTASVSVSYLVMDPGCTLKVMASPGHIAPTLKIASYPRGHTHPFGILNNGTITLTGLPNSANNPTLQFDKWGDPPVDQEKKEYVIDGKGTIEFPTSATSGGVPILAIFENIKVSKDIAITGSSWTLNSARPQLDPNPALTTEGQVALIGDGAMTINNADLVLGEAGTLTVHSDSGTTSIRGSGGSHIIAYGHVGLELTSPAIDVVGELTLRGGWVSVLPNTTVNFQRVTDPVLRPDQNYQYHCYVLFNQGKFIVGKAGQTVGPTVYFHNMDNRSQLEVSSGVLTLKYVVGLFNRGDVHIKEHAVLECEQSYEQGCHWKSINATYLEGGTLKAHGGVTITAGIRGGPQGGGPRDVPPFPLNVGDNRPLPFQAGALVGWGTVEGDVVNWGYVIPQAGEPVNGSVLCDGQGYDPAVRRSLEIKGNYTQRRFEGVNKGFGLLLQMAPDPNNQDYSLAKVMSDFDVTNEADLAGLLNVIPFPDRPNVSTAPHVSDQIITFTSYQRLFDNIMKPDGAQVIYESTNGMNPWKGYSIKNY